jgi:hypothetical protein
VANRTAEAGIEKKADCQQGIGAGHMSGDLRELKRAIRDYLKTVTLSEAKGLACVRMRFFATLRMTFGVLR